MIPVVHHPDYIGPPRAGSALATNKYGLVRDLLLTSGAAIDWIEPEAMPRQWLEAVHDPDYVAEVFDQRVPAAKERRIGFPVSAQVARRSARVPGGTWRAAAEAIDKGFAVNSAGGSHHALYDTGAGYCVFNDLAVAAHRLVEERSTRRILIVDCDVHQGDGTASLVAGRSEIATYSIHAEKNFPARKARSTLDVGLPDGVGDDEYLETLARTLAPLIADFRPSLLLYQAGVDPFVGDRLGRLSLSHQGLAAREAYIAGLATRLGLPLASTLGGGYGADVREVAERHVASMLALAGGFGLHKVAIATAPQHSTLDGRNAPA
jgi:acetoin utilization deacetylase AcuC-like enzyme